MLSQFLFLLRIRNSANIPPCGPPEISIRPLEIFVRIANTHPHSETQHPPAHTYTHTTCRLKSLHQVRRPPDLPQARSPGCGVGTC